MSSEYNFQSARRRFVVICTSRCNFNCPHCIRQGFDKQKTNHIDIPFSIFELCLGEFKKINYRHVSFTGGEPILHPEFEKLIAAAAEADYTFNIVSNGWFYQDYFPILDKYRFHITSLDFSLDGSVASIHDKVRNKRGSYQKVIEAIKFYKSKGFPVAAVSCFNQINLNDFHNIYQLVSSLKVDSWRVLAVDNIVGEKNSQYYLTDRERLLLQKEIYTLRKIYNFSATPVKLSSATTTKSFLFPPEIEFCRDLSLDFGTVIFPDGGMLFCCDIYKDCPDRPIVQKDGFWNSFKVAMATIEEIKKRRLKDILEGNFFEGFNTCSYCNKYIEEILKDIKKRESYGSFE